MSLEESIFKFVFCRLTSLTYHKIDCFFFKVPTVERNTLRRTKCTTWKYCLEEELNESFTCTTRDLRITNLGWFPTTLCINLVSESREESVFLYFVLSFFCNQLRRKKLQSNIFTLKTKTFCINCSKFLQDFSTFCYKAVSFKTCGAIIERRMIGMRKWGRGRGAGGGEGGAEGGGGGGERRGRKRKKKGSRIRRRNRSQGRRRRGKAVSFKPFNLSWVFLYTSFICTGRPKKKEDNNLYKLKSMPEGCLKLL